ncbi:hypothetical protein [Pseudomonas sp. LP_7_YM]|uniref:hypothetical protein n=1 Tax=Pseudomonas sp. LP_7_YM TaxID=2485137 RepID=UPI00105BAF80|nr:hypothetical protein [Pseudomonas sp. LP_7_YM]TDV70186.1 hypothetical protein EC915_102451 [Pseudomonas sp. LP_7_YM]
MIYSNVLSAVISALATDAMDNTSKQAWQKLYNPHNEGSADLSMLSSSRREGIDRKEADCWIYARLHSQLIPRHWNALVAKFSTHKGLKVQAIGELVPLVASPAPTLFRYKAVTTWAIPPLQGRQNRSGREVASQTARTEAELKAVTKQMHIDKGQGDELHRGGRETSIKRSTDMIVLPAEFYDMNTWDNEGRPESTRREWRRKIQAVLNEMVNEALSAAEVILEQEGVFLHQTA